MRIIEIINNFVKYRKIRNIYKIKIYKFDFYKLHEEKILKYYNSPVIKEMVRSRKLYCECFASNEERRNIFNEHGERIFYRFTFVDLSRAVAKILEINNDYIVVQLLNSDLLDLLKSEIKSNPESIRALPRIIVKSDKPVNFITFDLIYRNSENK